MLDDPLLDSCRQILHSTILQVRPVSGGDINRAYLLETAAGRYFLKANDHPAAPDMFRTEAAGLERIRHTGAIRCPQVLGYGRAGQTAFLLLEYMEPGEKSSEFWRSFGAELADLHRTPQQGYGLPFNNYIGSLPQPNPTAPDWPTCYRIARLQPQLAIARTQNRLQTNDYRQFDQLFAKLSDLLPDEPPSLIHGDLWSGNFLADSSGKAVLIDPAIGHVHREMDIAMTKLFGGFAPAFYSAYQGAFPLLPGWEERIPLYQLYYLLVHVNLFGGGYVQSVRQTLRRYL